MSEQQELTPSGVKKQMAEPWGEGRILAALHERYCAPAYAFFPHVRNQTGFSRTVRTADAIAMSLYPSRGLHLTGFEVKSDRHDWVRELRDPAKADEIAQHCDFWILVVGDREIVKPGELPTNWGLMAPAGKLLKTFVEPKLLGERDDRVARVFLAAILRRAMEDSPAENAIAAAVNAAVQKANRKRDELAERHASVNESRTAQELRYLRETVTRFEEASGIKVSEVWNSGDIGKAARTLQQCPRTDHLAGQLEEGARTLSAAAEELRKIGVPGVTVPEAGNKRGS